MSILSRLFRHAVWRYLVAVLLGAAAVGLVLLRNGIAYRLAWADALTVGGAVLVFVGLLGLVAHGGAFDFFGYSFSTLGNRRYKDMYAYSQAKRESRSHGGWTFMPFLTVGAAYLLIGLLVWHI